MPKFYEQIASWIGDQSKVPVLSLVSTCLYSRDCTFTPNGPWILPITRFYSPRTSREPVTPESQRHIFATHSSVQPAIHSAMTHPLKKRICTSRMGGPTHFRQQWADQGWEFPHCAGGLLIPGTEHGYMKQDADIPWALKLLFSLLLDK